MNVTEIQLLSWVESFIWPFIRITALFGAMPIFGSRIVPIRVRVALALAVTWLVFPVLPEIPLIEPFSLQAWLVSIEQVLIGVSMAFVLHMIISAFVVAGQIIAMQMGLGFAAMVDPQNGVQVPVIGQFFIIMITLLFFTLNVHLAMIDIIKQSFIHMPIGGEIFSVDRLFEVVLWINEVFKSAIKLALPVIMLLLTINIAMGVVTKSAPQFNLFAVGFPFMIVVGFIGIYESLHNVHPVLVEMLNSMESLVSFWNG